MKLIHIRVEEVLPTDFAKNIECETNLNLKEKKKQELKRTLEPNRNPNLKS